MVAPREELVDVVDLLIDAGQIRSRAGKIRQRDASRDNGWEMGLMRLCGMMLPGKVPPSGSRNGVVSEEKSPRRKCHRHDRGDRGDLLLLALPFVVHHPERLVASVIDLGNPAPGR